MKTIKFIPLMVFVLMAMPTEGQSHEKEKSMKTDSIVLTIEGGRTFTATLADNSSANALKELLTKGNIAVEMEDYGNMEKAGPIRLSLPQSHTEYGCNHISASPVSPPSPYRLCSLRRNSRNLRIHWYRRR